VTGNAIRPKAVEWSESMGPRAGLADRAIPDMSRQV
jgi:hypothetical protein